VAWAAIGWQGAWPRGHVTSLDQSTFYVVELSYNTTCVGSQSLQFTTISWAEVSATVNARHGLTEWRQVCRRHVVETLEHLDTDDEPNPVVDVQHEACFANRTCVCWRRICSVQNTLQLNCRSSSLAHRSRDCHTSKPYDEHGPRVVVVDRLTSNAPRSPARASLYSLQQFSIFFKTTEPCCRRV